MKKLCIAFAIVSFILLAPSLYARDVYTVRVDGAINPPIAGFVENSIEKASKDNAEALVILLDTPGGLDSSMRAIIKEMMDSPVPVIVYVSPSGARAASAGAIILLASHVAAMAPGTNAGAAHPVNIGKEKTDEVMMKKVVQDAEAYAKSIAAQRGRNVDFAAKAVTESISITAKDALAKKVIDVVADSVDDLLNQVDGKTVATGAWDGTARLWDVEPDQVSLPRDSRLFKQSVDMGPDRRVRDAEGHGDFGNAAHFDDGQQDAKFSWRQFEGFADDLGSRRGHQGSPANEQRRGGGRDDEAQPGPRRRSRGSR